MSNINISIDCVIFGFDSDLDLKLLLITKKENPKAKGANIKTQVALPGDLIKVGEDLDPAAKRILYSLTSIKEIYLKQFKVFSDPNRVKKPKDQLWLRNFRQNPEERVITIGYISLVNIENFKPKASSFADDVRWTSIHDIPELTFDHNEIVQHAITYLRKELNDEMSSILLPKNFTFKELQKLYETVLDKKFDKRNFKKHILNKGIITKTNLIKKTGKKGKPATYYKFN